MSGWSNEQGLTHPAPVCCREGRVLLTSVTQYGQVTHPKALKVPSGAHGTCTCTSSIKPILSYKALRTVPPLRIKDGY